VRPLFWLLYACSAWVFPVTVVAGTAVEGIAGASVRSVGVGAASHYDREHDR
jgi:hypothetical protein